MLDYGYAGNVLFVDLTNRSIRVEPLPEEDARLYIGGFGLNAVLAERHITSRCIPFSEDNALIVGAGVLGGTSAPGTGKVHMACKQANHRIGSAGGGGNMGFMLKHSGYDAVVIKGKSEVPVYLKVGPEPEICEAADLWGLDMIETTERLWDRHPGCSVISIGPASENLVKMSLALVDCVASLGRGGHGAVMGHKRLKAIVAVGGGKIRLYDPDAFLGPARRIFEAIAKDPLHESWVNEGIMIGWERWRQAGLSNENWTKVFPDEAAAKLWNVDAWKKNKIQNIACMSCPVADKHLVELRDGEYQGTRIYMSAYLHLANSVGVQLQLTEFDEVVKAFDVCNRYGIDVFSFCSLFNFAVELFRKGIITKEQTNGLELKMDLRTALEVMRRIAYREDIGDVLADGWIDGVERLGKEAAQYAHHIKGIDPMQDARNIFGTEHLGFVTNPRGAHIAAGESPSTVVGRSLRSFKRYAESIHIPQEAQGRIFQEEGFHTGRLLKWAEEHYSLFASMGVCARQQIAQRYSMDDLAALFGAATGLDLSPAALHHGGERIWNLYKMINVREGFAERDRFPEIWFQPLQDKGETRVLMDYFKKRPITRDEAERLLDDYYDERGWDRALGTPTPSKLKDLGLERTIEFLPELARGGTGA
jgi:aldehyde:ferredoxin oxidoreductase